VTALPVWAWVGVLVGVSAAVRFAIAQNYPGPWIFHDEIAYSDLARSFGRTGEFAIREVPGRNGFGVVYPALIAPAYALFDHVPTAYEAARAINAVVMSLVIVPTYLLARRLVRPSYALIAALLAVALPSMTYTTAIMTENAFYPLFILIALAMYLALERPTIVRQLFVFATILVAFYTRAQAVMFVPAYVLALVIVVLLDAGFETGGRFLDRLLRRLSSYWVSWAVLLGGGSILVIYEHIRGRPLSVLLGTYGGVSLFEYHVGPIARWFVYHIAELDMYVGLFPFAAFLFVASGLVFSERTRALRIFVAVSVPIVLCFAITVAAYASNPVGNRIEERNFFFVAPLLFIALLVWVDRGLNRRSLAAVASIIAACTLPGAIPFESIIDANAVTGTFGLLPLLKPGSMAKSRLDVIADITDQHAVIINRNREASMVLPGETLLVYEVVPALHAAVAANVAERAAPDATLVTVSMIGAAGRIYLSGARASVERARDEITRVLESVEGREH